MAVRDGNVAQAPSIDPHPLDARIRHECRRAESQTRDDGSAVEPLRGRVWAGGENPTKLVRCHGG